MAQHPLAGEVPSLRGNRGASPSRVASEPGGPLSLAHVRIVYRLLTLAFLFVALVGLGAHAARLAGVPLEPAGPMATYLGASMGAFCIGLAGMSWHASRQPEHASWLSGPMAAALVGLAASRLATLAFDDALIAMGLAPALAMEIVLISLSAAIVAQARPDAKPAGALARAFVADARALPLWLRLWALALFTAVVLGPLLFLAHWPAQVVLLSQAINLVGFSLYDRTGGLTRGLSVAHLVAWPVPWLVVLQALPNGGPESVYEAWLWLAAGAMGLSLLIDAVDTGRYALGDRAPIGPGRAGEPCRDLPPQRPPCEDAPPGTP
jgi:hypothetical protein